MSYAIFSSWKKKQEENYKFIVEHPDASVEKLMNILNINTKLEFENSTSAIFHSYFIGALGCINNVGAAIQSIYATSFNLIYDHFNEVDTWGVFTDNILKLIKTSIAEHHHHIIAGRTNSIKLFNDAFLRAKKAYENNPFLNKHYLYTHLRSLNEKFTDELVYGSLLRNETHSIYELQSFTYVATSHILFFYQIKKMGRDIFYSDEEYEDFLEFSTKKTNEYIQHAIDTYNQAVKQIRNLKTKDKNNNDVDVTGIDKFKKYLLLRSYCSTNVFDIIDLWKLFDFNVFTKGCHIENIRYVWGPTIGIPYIDPSLSPKDVMVNSTPPYNHPTFDSLLKSFVDDKAEEYMGDLQHASSYYDSEWVYSMVLEFKKPSGAIDTLKVGNMETDYDKFPKLLKEIDITLKTETSKVQQSGDFVPRSLTIDNINFFSFEIEKSATNRSYVLHGSPLSDLEIGVIEVDKKEFSVPEHKFANVYCNGANLSSLGDSNPSKVPQGHGVIDCLSVGFLPCGVFKENYLFEDRSTLINAQKYYNSSTEIHFKMDFMLPTVHAMLINANSIITFDYQFFNPKSKVKKYEIALRYYCTIDSKFDAEVGKQSQKNVLLTKCGDLNFNFRIKKLNPFDLTSSPKIDLKFYSNVYLQSIILTPST